MKKSLFAIIILVVTTLCVISAIADEPSSADSIQSVPKIVLKSMMSKEVTVSKNGVGEYVFDIENAATAVGNLIVADYGDAVVQEILLNGNDATNSQNLADFIVEGRNTLQLIGNIEAPITLKIRPAVNVKSAAVVPNVTDGTVCVSAKIELGGAIKSGKAEISLYELGKIGEGDSMHIGVGSEEIEYTTDANGIFSIDNVSVRINDFNETRKWSPDNPFIYELDVKLGEFVHKERFAMREITTNKETGYVELNGKPIFVTCFEVDDGVDLKKCKALGINAVKPIAELNEEECLETGLLIIDNSDKSTKYYTENESELENLAKKLQGIRAERNYNGIIIGKKMIDAAFSDNESETLFGNEILNSLGKIGIDVQFDKEVASRGEKFNVDVTVINDTAEDLGTVTVKLEIEDGETTLFSEIKDFDSLKKLGTDARDFMVRGFSFDIPKTIKDNTEIGLIITFSYEGEEAKVVRYVNVIGGEMYESPYSQFIVFGLVGGMAVLVILAAIISFGRLRKYKERNK